MRRYLIFFLTAAVAMLQGCIKDAPDSMVCPDVARSGINLSMGNMKVVETRSAATANECTIEDAYVLVFDGTTDVYKLGEKVELSNISGNGQKTPTIIPTLVLENGDKIVVLCNTGCTYASAAIPLTAGTSTSADINTAFPSTAWSLNRAGADSGKSMPMSGQIVWSTPPPTVQMYRSVAKIQLLLDIPAGADKTSSFTSVADAVKWGMYNVVQEGNIYSTAYDISTPTTVTFANQTAHPQRVVDAAGATAGQLSYYMPEYPSSATARGAAVADAHTFAVNRTCLIVHTSAGYYRLDLLTGNDNMQTKTFLDINRNYHYKVTIREVNSVGYVTVDEALANPAGNIEYEIVVTGDNDNFVNSNGQYALVSDKRDVVLLDNVRGDMLTFAVQTVEALNVTTAYVEIVDAARTSQVAMPEFFTVVKSGAAEELTVQSGIISLGTVTADTQFAMKANITPDVLAALATLEGCHMHITIGNIDRYIPISIEPTVNLNEIGLYHGTANCYEVEAGSPSTHTFDITPYMTTSVDYENTRNDDLCTPRSAAMLWSDVSTMHITDMTVTHTPQDTYDLTFTTNGTAGNAVIAIYNTADPTAANAKILWSYHIWVSDRSAADDQVWATINTVAKTVVPDAYTMMDRNLGATSNTIPSAENSYDFSSYGLYYQWGRKDPFAGGATYNASNTTVKKTTYSPVGVSETFVASTETVGTVTYAVQNPRAFITGVSGSQDWLYASRNHSLWGNPNPNADVNHYPRTFGVKSIYDPCPEGYQVPPQDAFMITCKPAGLNKSGTGGGGFAAQVAYWNITDGGASHVSIYYGMRFYCQDVGQGEVAYMPCAGYLDRANGKFYNGRTGGMYWTNTNNTKNNNNGSRASYGSTTWNPIWSSYRAMGQSVRCVKIK